MRHQLRSWLVRAGLLEAAVLTSLLIIAGAIWIFAEVADEVIEGESMAFDDSILLALRQTDDPSQPIGPAWVKNVARDFTALGGVSVITLVCVVTVGFLALLRKWGAVVLVLVSIGGGAIVSTSLKNWFERPRPSSVVHLTEVTSLSFPSGHSMLAAVTYLTLGTLLARTTADRRIKIYILSMAALFAVIIGTTRVYLGVHYPTDVLAGWCAGISWALMCSLVGRWLQKRGAVEPESPPKTAEVPGVYLSSTAAVSRIRPLARKGRPVDIRSQPCSLRRLSSPFETPHQHFCPPRPGALCRCPGFRRRLQRGSLSPSE